MKTFFTRILSTALCFILAFAVIQPAFAEGTDDFVDYDAPYIAFLPASALKALMISCDICGLIDLLISVANGFSTDARPVLES